MSLFIGLASFLALPDTPAQPGAAPAGEGYRERTPEQTRLYQQGLDLYRAGRNREAFEVYDRMAYDNPRDGVLGMIVATLAASHPGEADVDRMVRAADAAPDDLVKQFEAGVISHYFAHQSARTRDEKRRYYTQALAYLEKVRTAFDFEPRVFIYLAVSHFRLGNQHQAQALVERAVELSKDDPDAYYCRAEIYQRTNIQQSLADIDRYLSMMDQFAQQGAVVSDTKQERVRRMRRYLQAVADGEVQAVEVFDPMEDERVRSVAGGRSPFRTLALGGGVATLLALGGFAFFQWQKNARPGRG